MKLFLFIAAFALTVTGCRTTKDATSGTDVVSITHGTSFGHCVGYCVKEVIYTNGKMDFVQTSRSTENPEKRASQNYTEAEFSKLSNSIDWTKWKALPESIGCPDCADGGAEYIEIVTSQGTKRVTFEYGDTPEGLAKTLSIVRANRKKLDEAENGN